MTKNENSISRVENAHPLDELIEIANRLHQIAEQSGSPANDSSSRDVEPSEKQIFFQNTETSSYTKTEGEQWQLRPEHVRTEIVRRRKREEFFQDGLFADPAWDILLELYASWLEGQSVSVTNVCAAAAVPQTTALRWIDALISKELITRRKDPLDGRRNYLDLTQKGRQSMTACLMTVLQP